MSDVNKIYAGPGIFTWGVDEKGALEPDAVVFDLTQGGIRFFTETTYFEPTTDQTGTAPVKSFSTGTVGRVEFETPDMDFDKVVKFNANATKVTDATDPDKVKYQVTGLAGKELPRKRAMIQPQGVTDPERFIFLESCGIKFDANAQFMLDDNQKLPINAVAYPDLNATPRGLLYTWGDITATV
ncbi:hypothetical protein [Paenibacillus glucanolyticus]|uniref:hypothetical protein n=1 Tax=Paenibacillus glucanolyticus TaxID=59843 RepID=UPI00128B44D0|nr:hypothetical protein [Paenibacillus glucanolyticus]MPY20040.1 hypothetical protein [Paenibacillus glucanolyticus]